MPKINIEEYILNTKLTRGRKVVANSFPINDTTRLKVTLEKEQTTKYLGEHTPTGLLNNVEIGTYDYYITFNRINIPNTTDTISGYGLLKNTSTQLSINRAIKESDTAQPEFVSSWFETDISSSYIDIGKGWEKIIKESGITSVGSADGTPPKEIDGGFGINSHTHTFGINVKDKPDDNGLFIQEAHEGTTTGGSMTAIGIGREEIGVVFNSLQALQQDFWDNQYLRMWSLGVNNQRQYFSKIGDSLTHDSTPRNLTTKKYIHSVKLLNDGNDNLDLYDIVFIEVGSDEQKLLVPFANKDGDWTIDNNIIKGLANIWIYNASASAFLLTDIVLEFNRFVVKNTRGNFYQNTNSSNINYLSDNQPTLYNVYGLVKGNLFSYEQTALNMTKRHQEYQRKKLEEQRQELEEKIFKLWDVDKDGKLTEAEVENGIRKHPYLLDKIKK